MPHKDAEGPPLQIGEVLLTSRDTSPFCVKFVTLLFLERNRKGMMVGSHREKKFLESFLSYNSLTMAKLLVHF